MTTRDSWLWPVVLAGVVLALTVAYYFALLPLYPGNLLVLAGFSAASGALVFSLTRGRLSHVVIVFGTFTLLGFTAKLMFHLLLGIELTEPAGYFDGSAAQWDRALGFATAGISGYVAAVIASSALRMPGANPAPMQIDDVRARRICVLLALVALAALVVYASNWAFDIIRIGYPPKLFLPGSLHSLVSFAIAWGIMLAGLALVWWPVAAGRWHPSLLLYIATVLGVPATLTMGSRVQLLLYLAAAGLALLYLPSRKGLRTLVDVRVLIAVAVAVAALAFTLFAVNWQRDVDFSASVVSPAAEASASPEPYSDVQTVAEAGPPIAVEPGKPNSPDALVEPGAAIERQGETGPEVQAGPEPDNPVDSNKVALPALPQLDTAERTRRILATTASLAVRRWLGLEGTMAMAASGEKLGMELFQSALVESPSAGPDAIYQKLAGEPYAGVEHFEFLTIPGLVGVAAMSGNPLGIFTFCFALLLVAHAIEMTTGVVTRNEGARAVLGVALAYLLMQLNFPWALLALTIQFIAAVLVISLARFWIISRRVGATDAARPG